jgi:DNA-binding transcriptional ArsR family regulator
MAIVNTKKKRASGNCCGLNFPEKAPTTGMCLNPDDCAEKMMVLSDSNRLRIIRALLNGSRNVGEIAKSVNLGVHRVSHHLGIMRLVGLVEAKRQGRNINYSISQRVLTKKGLDLGCCTIQFRAL